MRFPYFYLVCAGGELDVRVYNPSSAIPDQPPGYTITEITRHGWETYWTHRYRPRQALPYAEAAYQALMLREAGGRAP